MYILCCVWRLGIVTVFRIRHRMFALRTQSRFCHLTFTPNMRHHETPTRRRRWRPTDRRHTHKKSRYNLITSKPTMTEKRANWSIASNIMWQRVAATWKLHAKNWPKLRNTNRKPERYDVWPTHSHTKYIILYATLLKTEYSSKKELKRRRKKRIKIVARKTTKPITYYCIQLNIYNNITMVWWKHISPFLHKRFMLHNPSIHLFCVGLRDQLHVCSIHS